MKKRLLAIIVLSGMSLLSARPSVAQAASTPAVSSDFPVPSDQEIDLLRKNLRSQKKQIVAANLKLTDKEAEKFWPVYDRYTADLVKINDAKYALIKEYAQSYANISDVEADSLIRRWTAIDQQVIALRLKYIPLVRDTVSGKSTALFFQIDRRIGLMIDMQIASQLPMIEP